MISIGEKPGSPFTEPLSLLSECHRRIERFLDQLIVVTERANGGALTQEYRETLNVALRYFQRAAPLHTQDEEASLFPRLRATDTSEARAALAAVEALEADRRVADALHAEADRLGQQWLTVGSLSPEDTNRLLTLLQHLRELYSHHIAVEDKEIFSLAGTLLESPTLTVIGREMAQRRGLDPDNLPSISHCQLRKTR